MRSSLVLIACLLSELVRVVGEMEEQLRAHAVCSSYGFTVLEARFGKETHVLCLKMTAIGTSRLTTSQSQLFVDPESQEPLAQPLPLGDITMAYGFPVQDPALGSAEGYIGEDQQFYGVLHIGKRILYADPYNLDDPTKYFGGFENDDIAVPLRMRRDFAQISFPHAPFFPFQIAERSRTPGVARARICDLLLLADQEFYEKDANSSLTHAVRRMMHAVAQADIIFRNADFNEDGVPDNIGFSVKYILVLTSNETNSRVFGDLLRQRSVDGRTYLMKFARLRRLSEVCLGVAFSGHAFHNRTLGLSFTSLGGGMGGAAGGLCDRRAYGRSFNTLALSHATTDSTSERVPERISALTLAHEMGHSFGAHHDDNFPTEECRGYLMSSQSTAANNPMHFEFSVCSKRLIATTLNSMSYCLAEEDRPYCGNGIVEEGEACDCGLPSRCSDRDPCCTPRAGGALALEEGTLHKDGCSVAPSAMCHPSQGLCCTSNCTYANLTAIGIDCRSLDRECSCAPPTADCRCGLGGRCLRDGSCHAAECAKLGLHECSCLQSGAGGEVGKAGMCGVCCQLPAASGEEPRCVGAESAAQELVANGTRLPQAWPDEDYAGPNVSVRICVGASCTRAWVRAWAAGGPCVARGTVGVCSPRGRCKPGHRTPRSNVYPDIMGVKLMTHGNASGRALKPTLLAHTVIVVIMLVEYKVLLKFYFLVFIYNK